MFAQPRIMDNGRVSHGGDEKLHAVFSLEPLQDEEASEKEGRPIFRDVKFITIYTPGDTTKIVKRPVEMKASGGNAPDPQRFPLQWAHFMNQQEQAHDGTPLEQWAPVTKSMAMELKAIHIHTVEQLAALSDANCTFTGAHEWRERAKAWLASATDGKAILKMQKDNENLKAQLEALKNQLDGMAKDAPKRGRPPANKEEVNEDIS